jgi:hypothetical protein
MILRGIGNGACVSRCRERGVDAWALCIALVACLHGGPMAG